MRSHALARSIYHFSFINSKSVLYDKFIIVCMHVFKANASAWQVNFLLLFYARGVRAGDGKDISKGFLMGCFHE